METLEKYTWLKKINSALLTLDEVPLLRNYAPFNFDELNDKIAKKFSLKHVKITSSELKWLSKDEIKSGLSDNINYLSFVFSPVEGHVYLLMDLEDISKLTNELLDQKSKIKFSSTILQESYFRFVSLETLNILASMNLFQDLSPKMVETPTPLDDNALCLDIKIEINEISCFARIAITPTFRKAFEGYFANNPPLKALEISKNLDLIMKAELGYVNLSYEAFKKVKTGDFIILDHINYDLKTDKGQVILKLGDTALFISKIKQNKLKILDFANLQEDISMEKKDEETKETPKEEKPAKEEVSEVEEIKEIPTARLENMPITIVVEAARFKVTLDKLMNMQPGNLLDLAVHPQRGVNLVVNGQKIARGELVNLGETLGVRLLEMG